MDFDALVEVKSGLGTAAVIVMDKSVNIRVLSETCRLEFFSTGRCDTVHSSTDKVLSARKLWSGWFLRSHSKWSLCGLWCVKSLGDNVYLFILCSVPLAGRALFGWTKLWRDLVSITIILELISSCLCNSPRECPTFRN